MPKFKIKRDGTIVREAWGFGDRWWEKPTRSELRAIRRLLTAEGMSVQLETPPWEVDHEANTKGVTVNVVRGDEKLFIGHVPHGVPRPLSPEERRRIEFREKTARAKAAKDWVIYGQNTPMSQIVPQRPMTVNPDFSEKLSYFRALAEDRAADLNALLG